MVQYRVFTGGASLNSGALTPIGDGSWFKEVVYVLPSRKPGIAVPVSSIANAH